MGYVVDLIYILLANKIQVWLCIEDVRSVAWNESVYDELVFAPDQKDLLLSFVQNHSQMSGQRNDIMLDKGIRFSWKQAMFLKSCVDDKILRQRPLGIA